MTMFMTLFMLYMIGNSLQIISIVITIGMVLPQTTALFRVGEAFKHLEDERTKYMLLGPKLVYCALHSVILAAALYKFSSNIISSRSRHGIDPCETY